MTIEKNYDGYVITLSTDVELLRSINAEGRPVILLINNENRFEDASFAKFAIEIEPFREEAYNEDGEYIEGTFFGMSEEEILTTANDEYCRIVLARTEGRPLEIVRTSRLIIAELSVSDVNDFVQIYDDCKPEFIEKFFEDTEEAKEYLKRYIEEVYEFYNFGIWGVYLLDDMGEKGELIGIAGFSPRECVMMRDEELSYNETGMNLELGYAINSKYRRQGYGYEATRAIIDYAKENMEYNIIYVNIAEGNAAGIALAEKLGLLNS